MNRFNTSVWAIVFILVLQFAANAQVTRRKDLPVTAESKAVERTSVGNTSDMIAYFEDLKVSLNGSTTFTITFFSKPGLVPTVQIGTSSPRQQGGRWVFQEGETAGEGNAFASSKPGPLSRKVGTVANTLYTFESSMFQMAEIGRASCRERVEISVVGVALETSYREL